MLASSSERRALITACMASLPLGFLFSGITLGIFALLTAAALGRIYVLRAQTRASLARTSDRSFPKLAELVRTAAYRLNMEPVEVYVRQSPHLNASTSGVGRHSWVVIESGLVEALSAGELLFVIGHELGHVRRRHVLWQLLMGQGGHVRIPLVTAFFSMLFSSWARESEYTADRAGVIATGDGNLCCSALLKLSAGSGAHQQISVEEFLGSTESQSELASALGELLQSHPLEGHRVQEILRFARFVSAGEEAT